MMRKLAVTVFALSLAALGCGSDSGTKTPDSAVTPDGGKTPDAYVAQGVDAPAPDTTSMGAEVQIDTQKGGETQQVVADVPVDQAPLQTLDTAPVDGLKGVDAEGVDGSKQLLDSGADAPKVDAAVDTGNVDGGTVG